MVFSVYRPPQAGSGAKLPVIWYLSGLTCTHANVTEKGEYRRACAELDLILVGGGDVRELMRNPEVLAFLRDRGPKARYVTSVCTGALVLGAAGLLNGYKAATHWTTMDLLPLLGAMPVHDRVVVDRNRITGGGVTAGIDFGLNVVAEIWGREMAEMLQLASEYDPAPPFSAGSPRNASARSVASVQDMVRQEIAEMKAIASEAGRALAVA